MNTSVINTWPIATRKSGEFLLIGVPQRLGGGTVPTAQNYFTFPSLEEVAGEDWQAKILEILLPKSHAWAWWVPSECKGLKQLAPAGAPDRISLDSLTAVVAKRWLLRGRKLVVIPAENIQAQAVALEWAGMDTEQQPEFLFAFSPESKAFDLQQLGEWCADRERWSDPTMLASLGVDQVVMMFDGAIYLAASDELGLHNVEGLKRLAGLWGLHVIAGAAEMAWPC